MAGTITRPIQDFTTAVAVGAIRNSNGSPYLLRHQWGRNPSVTATSGVGELVSYLGGIVPVYGQTSAQSVRVKAGGHAFDADGLNGAWEIEVVGLDANLDIASEKIKTAGASASAYTTTKFWRVFDAYVTQCGSYGGINIDLMTIENEVPADILVIDSRYAQALFGGFTVPRQHTCIVQAMHFAVSHDGAAKVRLITKGPIDIVAAPFVPYRVRRDFGFIPSRFNTFEDESPLVLEEKTDVYFTATIKGAAAAAEVAVGMDLLLIPNR